MGANDRPHQPREVEAAPAHPLHRGLESPQTDGLKLNLAPLPVDHKFAARLTHDFGGDLKTPAEKQALQGFVEATMSGNLKKLAEIADPKNSAVADAYSKMMDKMGYNVVFNQAHTPPMNTDYNSAYLVSKADAGREQGGFGLELRYQKEGNVARAAAYATENTGGPPILYPRDPNVFKAQRTQLGQFWQDVN